MKARRPNQHSIGRYVSSRRQKIAGFANDLNQLTGFAMVYMVPQFRFRDDIADMTFLRANINERTVNIEDIAYLRSINDP